MAIPVKYGLNPTDHRLQEARRTKYRARGMSGISPCGIATAAYQPQGLIGIGDADGYGGRIIFEWNFEQLGKMPGDVAVFAQTAAAILSVSNSALDWFAWTATPGCMVDYVRQG